MRAYIWLAMLGACGTAARVAPPTETAAPTGHLADGTDLGNTRDAGPSAAEVELLRAAGLDDAAITDAMTTAPLAFWGITAGPAVGREATFVMLAGDPRRDASVLLHPRATYVRGTRVR